MEFRTRSSSFRALAGPCVAVAVAALLAPPAEADPWSRRFTLGEPGRAFGVPTQVMTFPDGRFIVARSGRVMPPWGEYQALFSWHAADGTLSAAASSSRIWGGNAQAVAVTPSGELVVAGSGPEGSLSAPITRYAADGRLLWSTSLSVRGRDLSGSCLVSFFYASELLPLADGSVVVNGWTAWLEGGSDCGGEEWLATLAPDGSVLAAWPGNSFPRLAALPDGTFLAATSVSVGRYRADGSHVWWATFPPTGGHCAPVEVVALGDGGAVHVRACRVGVRGTVRVTRLASDGGFVWSRDIRDVPDPVGPYPSQRVKGIELESGVILLSPESSCSPWMPMTTVRHRCWSSWVRTARSWAQSSGSPLKQVGAMPPPSASRATTVEDFWA